MVDIPFRGVILCGGSGSRLWPLSRQLLPKQFIRLMDEHSLLQNTLLRLLAINGDGVPVLVCNEAHRFIVHEQANELGITDVDMIVEPCQRNTAPAIAAATLRAMRGGDDPVMLVMPSDHLLENCEALQQALACGYEAASSGALVTFGITPTGPLSGYGYVQAGEDYGCGTSRRVQRFVEKPPTEVAQRSQGSQSSPCRRHSLGLLRYACSSAS